MWNPIQPLGRWFKRPHPTVLKYGVTIEEFKSDPARVSAMNRLFNSPVFQNALGVIVTVTPPLRRYDNPNNALFDLGVTRGVRETIDLLRYLGEHPIKIEQLEPTWGVEQDDNIPEQPQA